MSSDQPLPSLNMISTRIGEFRGRARVPSSIGFLLGVLGFDTGGRRLLSPQAFGHADSPIHVIVIVIVIVIAIEACCC
jgi:hypothetical protein